MNPFFRTIFSLAGGLSRSGREAYRRDYDLRAGTYEEAETRPLLKRVTEEFVSELGLRPGMRCLDLGCGTGYSSFLLDRLVRPSGRVEGCDNSEGMLREAGKSRFGGLEVSRFTRSEMLDFLRGRPGGSADLVGSFWSAEYSPLGRLFALVPGVLDKGGAAAMLINTCESLSELQSVVSRALIKRPGCVKCFPPVNFPPDLRTFRRYAEKSGLCLERLESCSLEHVFKDTASAVRWIRESGPAAGLTASLKKERVESFFSAVSEEIDRRGGLSVTFRFLKFVGRKK